VIASQSRELIERADADLYRARAQPERGPESGTGAVVVDPQLPYREVLLLPQPITLSSCFPETRTRCSRPTATPAYSPREDSEEVHVAHEEDQRQVEAEVDPERDQEVVTAPHEDTHDNR
jgi:hypothetical protein